MLINRPGELCVVIKSLRLNLAMSQDDLAISSGISKATIASLETGRRVPSIETLFTLIEAMGCELTLEIRFRNPKDGILNSPFNKLEVEEEEQHDINPVDIRPANAQVNNQIIP